MNVNQQGVMQIVLKIFSDIPAKSLGILGAEKPPQRWLVVWPKTDTFFGVVVGSKPLFLPDFGRCGSVAPLVVSAEKQNSEDLQ